MRYAKLGLIWSRQALAFGAKAVFVGRPVLWGLSVGGEDGVLDVLNLLRAELEQSMKLAGVRSIEEISRKVIFDESKSIIPRAAL
jgi:isopentenyl diphosphate isomerase/L-lactate dehydrogenase-like FMN-dependent dehydrogenase